jgi:hypothetical protein
MVDAPVYDYGTATRPASARAWGGPAPETLETPEGTLRKLVFYSDTYDIDRIYKSMQGPATTMELRLSPSGSKPELIWLKGVRADVVGEDGTEFGSQEFMCHVVAAVKSPRFDEARKEIGFDPRFATLSQGQYFKEFPEGFGTPILSGDIIQVASQVLNFNERERRPRVRHRIVVLYMRDSERRMPMQALRGGYAQAMVRLGSDKEGATYGVLHPDGVTAGASCSPGDRAQSTVGVFPDRYGRLFSGHWVVKPGYAENRTLVTEQLNLNSDTRIHSIDVHMHAFAESIELRDLTEDKTVFVSRAMGIERGIGVAKVETYSSSEGIPLYKDHEYAVISVYDNPTGENQDAMASLYMGLADPQFSAHRLLGRNAFAELGAPATGGD